MIFSSSRLKTTNRRPSGADGILEPFFFRIAPYFLTSSVSSPRSKTLRSSSITLLSSFSFFSKALQYMWSSSSRVSNTQSSSSPSSCSLILMACMTSSAAAWISASTASFCSRKTALFLLAVLRFLSSRTISSAISLKCSLQSSRCSFTTALRGTKSCSGLGWLSMAQT